MVKFGRKEMEYGVVLGFLKEFAQSASDVIRNRFSMDGELLASPERDTCKTRQSHSGISGDDRQLREIFQWLAPAAYECGHYQDDLEDARSLRYPGTCQWIEARPEFVTWSNCQSEATQSFLWIYAIPGAGKTVLASYLVELLKNSDNDHTRSSPVFYFFCKDADTDKNNALAVTKALAHQLLQSPQAASSDILKDLKFQMDRGGRSRAINFRPLFELLCRHLSNLSKPIIIVDAADECSDIDRLLPGFIRLTEKGTVKVILTSRREPNLVGILQNKPTLGMGPGDVQKDIKSYLEYQVSQSSKLSDPHVCHRVTRILNIRSKGMFLWVALMIRELNEMNTIEEIEYTLTHLPDGLNEVYERILTRLRHSFKPSSKTFCCKVLKWITLAKRPLRLTELGEALKIQYEAAVEDFTYSQHLLCSTRELELVCGSLVTVKDGIIQLIHLSTKEFLVDQKSASNAGPDLQAFFVQTQDDSAVLSGICVKYLANRCVPGKLSRNDSSKGWQMDDSRLLEYAYLNWIVHLTDSSSQTLERQKPIVQPFLKSRNSVYWLELCFTINHDIYRTLSAHLQAVLDWCLRCEPPIGGGSRPPQDLLPLLCYWAKSYLHLLDDYGPSLSEWPEEVHRIDPTTVFEPSDFKILESLRHDGSYHRHYVLEDSKLRRNSTTGSTYRALQKHTGTQEDYGYFFLDERRQVFFMLDLFVTTAPRIYCQDIVSGKRLPPIVDTEFGESNDDIKTQGAKLSACGQYMGIVYNYPERQNKVVYTVIWHLSEYFDFNGVGPPRWAQKHISLSAISSAPVGNESANPIAFGVDGFVYCPHGRINLRSGVQEPYFCDPEDPGPLNLTLSGDARRAVRRIDDPSEGIFLIEDISPKGEPTTIHSWSEHIEVELGPLSSSGLFLVWKQIHDDDTYSQVYVYNTYLRKVHKLDKSSVPYSYVRFLFSEDEKILLGVYNPSAHQTTRIRIWRQTDSSFNFWAEKSVRGPLRGFCLQNNLLYITSPGRIWSRLDISTTSLVDLDTDSHDSRLDRIEHGISRDGTRMIILRWQVEGKVHSDYTVLLDGTLTALSGYKYKS
ncbi:MAG: hypothetical protein L6R42_000248 [Xanthoria sp. 1 TBL-2021]|nr:MAG: hypothetical protein L6R42_000248 [Xanthoria sp. 1 TBL-2021]